ncbi:MAG: hypothetical protein KDA87_22470, partial [Planctomycetales bacterium]|nr:hypothetical protein [Planctomycetales bacterium]
MLQSRRDWQMIGIGFWWLSLFVGQALVHADDSAHAEEAVRGRLRSSLEFLASDELKGRATGSAEMDVAAE